MELGCAGSLFERDGLPDLIDRLVDKQVVIL